MKSFEGRMQEVGGFGPGFDLIRIVLALGVLGWHALAVVEGTTIAGKATGGWLLIYAILPMFFALSGYLVTGSALRLPLRQYILNRTFRIVPALGVDVAVSALVLGPIFTVLTLGGYFTGTQFWAYFLNIIGWVQFELPGVFEGNPLAGIVNGSLWTVPYEIACYVVMSLLIWFGLIRRLVWTAGLAAAWLTAAVIVDALGVRTGIALADKGIDFLLLQQGSKLIPYFLAGAAFCLAQGRIPFDKRIAGAIVVGLAAASLLVDGEIWWEAPITALLACLPLTYLVVYAGLLRLPTPAVLRRGDYSYGVYLYHFPILQALQHVYGFSSWAMLAAASLAPIALLATLSWHNIEKPVLKLRKRFSLTGARVAANDTARAREAGSPGAWQEAPRSN